MGSKQTSQQSSSQTYSPPPEVLANYKAVTDQAKNVAATPYQAYGGDLVAGINNQQTAGINAVNNASGIQNPYNYGAAGLAGASAQNIDPTQFSAAQLQQYENPFQQDVINATMAQIRNQNRQQAADLQGNAISAGAFGGDRAGVAQAALAGQQGINNNATLANLNAANFANALGEFNTQQGVNLGAQQNTAARQLAASQQFGNLGSTAQQEALAGANAQVNAGTLQQQTQQAQDTAAYNQFLQKQAYPFQTTGWLANIVEGIGSQSGGTSTGTTTTQGGNGLSSIAGGLLGLASFLNRGGRVNEIRVPHKAGGGALLPYGVIDPSAGLGAGSYVVPANLPVGHTIPTNGAPTPAPVTPAGQDMGQTMKAAKGLGSAFENSSIGDAFNDYMQDSGGLGGLLGGLFARGGSVRPHFDDGGDVSPDALWAAADLPHGVGPVPQQNDISRDAPPSPEALAQLKAAMISAGAAPAPVPEVVAAPIAPAAPAKIQMRVPTETGLLPPVLADKLRTAMGGDPPIAPILPVDGVSPAGIAAATPEDSAPAGLAMASRATPVEAAPAARAIPVAQTRAGLAPVNPDVPAPGATEAQDARPDPNAGLLGLHLSPEARQGLLAAGLGMLGGASMNPWINIGQGGQQGLAAYNNARKLQAEIDLQRAQAERQMVETGLLPAKTASEIGLQQAQRGLVGGQAGGVDIENKIKQKQLDLMLGILDGHATSGAQKADAVAANADTITAPTIARNGPAAAQAAPQPKTVDPRSDPFALRAEADRLSLGGPMFKERADRMYAQAAAIMSGEQQVQFTDGTTGYYPGVTEAKAKQAAAVRQAEVPAAIDTQAGVKNFETQNTYKTTAANEAENGQNMMAQALALRNLMFDPKTGAPLVNSGPYGEKIAGIAATLKQFGVGDHLIAALTGTDPNNAQAIEKLRTSLGSETARADLANSQVRVNEFQRYLASVPNSALLPAAYKFIIDKAIIPKAQQQIQEYEAVKDLDPRKDDIRGKLFEYRQAHPWYAGAPPVETADRVKGAIYANPQGRRARWTGTGWAPVQ